MKNCTHCKHADWKLTSAGKLHPSGDGRCAFPYKVPALPQAFYWLSGSTPAGGYINRRRELADHCTYFARGETP